jgi:hypothetical protein
MAESPGWGPYYVYSGVSTEEIEEHNPRRRIEENS